MCHGVHVLVRRQQCGFILSSPFLWVPGKHLKLTSDQQAFMQVLLPAKSSCWSDKCTLNNLIRIVLSWI